MAGFLGNVGTGLGGFFGGFNQQRKADEEQQQSLLLNQLRAQALRDANDQRQAQSRLWSVFAGQQQLPQLPMGNAPPVPGIGGMQPPTPPLPGQPSVPMQQPMRGAGGSWTPLAPYARGSAAVGGPSPVDYLDPQFTRQVSAGVDAMPPDIRKQFTVESGFRDPAREAEVYRTQHPGQPVPQDSAHSHGTALDMGDRPAVEQWWDQHPEFGVGRPLKNLPGEANHLQLLNKVVPAPVRQEARATAATVMKSLPAQAAGTLDLSSLAQKIEAANPDADPVVKMMVLENAQKLLAPQDQRIWEAYKLEHTEAFTRETERINQDFQRSQTQSSQAFTAGQQRSSQGFQREQQQRGFAHEDATGGTLQTEIGPDGQPIGSVSVRGTQVRPIQGLEPGHRLEPPSITGRRELADTKPDPDAVNLIKSYTRGGLTVPYSFRSGKQGQANMNAAQAELSKEGFTGGEAALAQGDVKALDSAYRQLQAQYSKIQPFKNLAVRNLEAAAKQLEGTAPTDLGPLFNRYIAEGEKMLGDPGIPATNMIVLTSVNELARVLSSTTGAGQLTDSARREAAEVLSPYFSTGQFKAAKDVAVQEMDRRTEEMLNELNSLRDRLKTGASPGATRGPTPERQMQPGGTQPAAASPTVRYNAKGEAVHWTGTEWAPGEK